MLSKYCTERIGEIIESGESYIAGDWKALQTELKDLFFSEDEPKHSTAALYRLIKDSPNISMNLFIHQFGAISKSLIEKGTLYPSQQAAYLLDGIHDEDLRRRAIRFCSEKSWRLSEHDKGTADPNFDELKAFVLKNVNSSEAAREFDKGKSGREVAISSTVSTVATNLSATPIAGLDELDKRLAQLTTLVESRLTTSQPMINAPAPTASLPATTSSVPNLNRPPPRCVICDTVPSHPKWACPDFLEAVKAGKIKLNSQGRVVNAVNGEELPINFRRGGMKVYFPNILPNTSALTTSTNQTSTPNINSTSAITYSEPMPTSNSAKLESGYLRVTKIDPETGKESEEILNAFIEEKRKRDANDRGRRVRPWPEPTDPPYLDPNSEDSNTNPPAPASTPVASPPPPEKPKFRLASELNQTINAAQIGRRL